MNIQLTFQFFSLDEAAKFLVLAAERNVIQAGAVGVAGVSGDTAARIGQAMQEQTTTVPKRGPGRPPKAQPPQAAEPPSAPPAAEPSAASEPEPASAPTPAPAPKVLTYAESTLPDRIKGIVQGKDKIPQLKALLAEFGVASGKDLKPEQLVDFDRALALLEAATPAEADLG